MVHPSSDLPTKLRCSWSLNPLQILKKVRHSLALTEFYRKFICNYAVITHPLNYLTSKAEPLIWTLECQASFDMLCSRLANTPIVQLPNPNKPYLLFTDVDKFFYSGVLTKASTQYSIEALLKILPSEAPSKVANLKHRTFNLNLMSFIL